MSARRADRRAARGARGFTLVELLLVTVLLVTLTLAVLDGFDAFARGQGRVSSITAAQATARQAVDDISRELRNGANRTGSGTVVERAQAADLVVLVPNSTGTQQTRVRYCVGPVSAGRRSLWRQSVTLTAPFPALAASAACPDTGWTTSGALITSLVPPTGASTVEPFGFDAVTASGVTRISTTLAVQAAAGAAAPATLSSGVALRNQNRPPVAAFTATATSDRRMTLDGSNSADPDDQTLVYLWRDGTTQIGSTSVLSYQAPSAGNRTISLTVTDPSGATSTTTQTVVAQ